MSSRTTHPFPSRFALLLAGALAFTMAGATIAATPSSASATPSSASATPSQDELDALLAPIALYPDGLLGQVLIASTYPLEVVAAERFVRQNPELRGEALDEALAKRRWDPSVQSLAAYPNVLIMMSEKLEWTERLGNAFLEDQGRVMETVQALRKRADAAGNLRSTNEQKVVREKETIVIEPAQREVVYVYDYDPAYAYGAYWHAGAAYYYGRYYGTYSYSVSVSSTSYRVSDSHWGWARANWRDRNVSVDARGNRFWSDAGRSHEQGAWKHDVAHRRGVDASKSAMQDPFRGPGNGPPRGGEGKAGPGASGPGTGARPGGADGPPFGGAPPGLGASGAPFGGGPPGFGAGGLPKLGAGGPPAGGPPTGGPPMGGPPMGGPPPGPPGPPH